MFQGFGPAESLVVTVAFWILACSWAWLRSRKEQREQGRLKAERKISRHALEGKEIAVVMPSQNGKTPDSWESLAIQAMIDHGAAIQYLPEQAWQSLLQSQAAPERFFDYDPKHNPSYLLVGQVIRKSSGEAVFDYRLVSRGKRILCAGRIENGSKSSDTAPGFEGLIEALARAFEKEPREMAA